MPPEPFGIVSSTITGWKNAGGNVISLHMPLDTEDDGAELLDTIPDTVDHAEEYEVRAASQQEIQEFSEKLSGLADVFRCGG